MNPKEMREYSVYCAWRSLLRARYHQLFLLFVLGLAVSLIALAFAAHNRTVLMICISVCGILYALFFRLIKPVVPDALDNLAREAAVRIAGHYGRWAALRLFQRDPMIFTELLYNNPTLISLRDLRAEDWARILAHPDPKLREYAFRAWGTLSYR